MFCLFVVSTGSRLFAYKTARGSLVELRELIQGAQEAMDRGDYRLAIAANNHAIRGYAGCLAAHRMLGEAYLERGDQQAAVTHFERTLAVDPLNVVARLGLGVAAEETKNYQNAYAHYLHAWEINPALDQVRDELVRLRGVLNVDDRLHPTRAGLAGIHARSGQFKRATAEWRAVLAAEPESRRGRTSLAELLWRQGDDANAALAAREALRGSPDNGRALAILADIERRRGSGGAVEIAERYAAADPTGDIVSILQGWRTDVDLSFLIPESALIDDFDFDANRSQDTGPLGSRRSVTASLAASQLAAPDLWDTLVQDLSDDIPSTNVAPTMATAVEPFSWSEGSADPRNDSGPSGAMVPTVSFQPAPTLEDIGEGEDLGMVPFDLSSVIDEQGEHTSAESIAQTADLVAEQEDADSYNELMMAMAVAPAVANAMNQGETQAAASGSWIDDFTAPLVPARSDAYGDTVAFTRDPMTGSVMPDRTEIDETSLTAAFGESSMADSPSPVSGGDLGNTMTSKSNDYVDPFVTADGKIDLTSGWDDLDRQLAAATPGGDGSDAFDDLLAELNVDGIQPFDAVSESPDEDAWAPFSDNDFEVPVAQAAPLTPEAVVPEPEDERGQTLDFADLAAFDVAAFDETPAEPAFGTEILNGIPGAQPSGYTELLRNMDEETPFDMNGMAPISGLERPDATGNPLDFDELIGVTSTDGTGPLTTLDSLDSASPDNPFDFAGTDLEAAMPPLSEDPIGLDMGEIQPFDSTSFAGEDFSSDGPDFGFAAAVAPVVGEQTNEEFDAVAPFAFDDHDSQAFTETPFDFGDVDEVTNESLSLAHYEQDSAIPEFAVAAAIGISAREVLDSPADPIELIAVAEPEPVEPEEPAQPQPGWAGREGLGTVARKVLWPQFVNQTSTLIDRAMESENLFQRIAMQKAALVEMGVVGTARPLVVKPVEAVVSESPVASEPVSIASGVGQKRRTVPEMSEQTRMDLMGMRIRLVEDEDAAAEIAAAVEKAISEGLYSPLAMRVLGEAYLKLGLVERAAAQFRQAMLARRKSA